MCSSDLVIDEKVESGGKDLPAPPRAAKKSGKVIDLLSVLQQSLDRSADLKKSGKKSASAEAGPAKHAKKSRKKAA